MGTPETQLNPSGPVVVRLCTLASKCLHVPFRRNLQLPQLFFLCFSHVLRLIQEFPKCLTPSVHVPKEWHHDVCVPCASLGQAETSPQGWLMAASIPFQPHARYFVAVYRSNPLATYTETALRVSWLEVFKLDDNQKDVQGQCPFLPSKSSVLGLPGPEFSHEWDSPTCVIISRTEIFHVVAPLWLDSLYLRRRPAAYFPFSFIYNAGDAATLYATNITVQDNGPLNSTAVLCDDGAQALCAGAAPSYTGALVWLGHADTKSIGSRYPVDR